MSKTIKESDTQMIERIRGYRQLNEENEDKKFDAFMAIFHPEVFSSPKKMAAFKRGQNRFKEQQ